MAGTRNNTKTNEPVILQAQIKVNSVFTEPFSYDKVEIYDNLTDADAQTNPIETILSGDITSNGNGLATYIAGDPAGFAIPGTFYDRLFFTLSDGGAQSVSNSLPFFVHEPNVGFPPPGDKETALIKLNLCKISGFPLSKEKVTVTMCSKFAKYDNNLMENGPVQFISDENGIVDMVLVETTTPTLDSGFDVFYQLSALDGTYKVDFIVPKGTVSSDFFDLPTYPVTTG